MYVMYILRASHRKLDVVLMQILPYIIVQKPIRAFARIRRPQQYPDAGFILRPLKTPHYFFSLRRPAVDTTYLTFLQRQWFDMT